MAKKTEKKEPTPSMAIKGVHTTWVVKFSDGREVKVQAETVPQARELAREMVRRL